GRHHARHGRRRDRSSTARAPLGRSPAATPVAWRDGVPPRRFAERGAGGEVFGARRRRGAAGRHAAPHRRDRRRVGAPVARDRRRSGEAPRGGGATARAALPLSIRSARSPSPRWGERGPGGEAVKIYTKTGDDGETGLFGGARVPKDDARVGAYGDV